MGLVDVLIVYLALGAPVAVYNFLELAKEAERLAWARSVLSLIFWPVHGTCLIWRQLASNNTQFATTSDLDAAIEQRTRHIAELLKPSSLSSAYVYEMRDIFDRYAALMLEVDSWTDGSAAELMNAAGRDEKELGTICINRRNAARLARHQTDARDALLRAVETAATSGTFPPDAVKKAAELAELLGDETTERSLREIIDRQNYWTEPEGESWKLQSKPARIEASPMQFSTAATAASKSD